MIYTISFFSLHTFHKKQNRRRFIYPLVLLFCSFFNVNRTLFLKVDNANIKFSSSFYQTKSTQKCYIFWLTNYRYFYLNKVLFAYLWEIQTFMRAVKLRPCSENHSKSWNPSHRFFTNNFCRSQKTKV